MISTEIKNNFIKSQEKLDTTKNEIERIKDDLANKLADKIFKKFESYFKEISKNFLLKRPTEREPVMDFCPVDLRLTGLFESYVKSFNKANKIIGDLSTQVKKSYDVKDFNQLSVRIDQEKADSLLIPVIDKTVALLEAKFLLFDTTQAKELPLKFNVYRKTGSYPKKGFYQKKEERQGISVSAYFQQDSTNKLSFKPTFVPSNDWKSNTNAMI